MRAASWESSAGALATFLNSATQGYLVDLFTFTLSGGLVVRYTSADVPVTINGNTFANGPVISRGKTKLSVGVSVDSLGVTIACDLNVTLNGVALLPFIASGGFDGARCVLERAFAASPTSAWVGTLILFKGRVSDTHASRYEASLTVNSDLELLNVMIPRNVYQPGCSNTLFDAACTLSKAANGYGALATSTTDAKQTTFSTGLAFPVDYLSLGFATGVSGANAGISRTIRYYAGGVITTIQPWPSAVAVNDLFTVYPGCDKSQATCASKFNNVIHFRGQPYVPAPETIA